MIRRTILTLGSFCFIAIYSRLGLPGAGENERGSVAPQAIESPAATTFELDPQKRVYEIGVSWEGAADIRFGVPCAEPSIGDPNRFGIEYAPRGEGQPQFYQHRFVLAAKKKVLGARTFVTFDCAEQVRVVLMVTLVSYERATFQVDFVMSAKENARVRNARKKQREESERACGTHVEKLRAQWKNESEDALLAGLARRHSARGSVARGRDDFLKVKTVKELVIDKRGYVIFEIKNRSGAAVTMKSVEVVDGDGRPLSGVRYHFAATHIENEHRTVGSVGFEVSASKYVRLLVRDEGNRAVEVDDVRVF